jgi:hypothetical protein
MRRLYARRPTPAMAVAFIALLAALSGTAVALPGTNTVDSGDIKRGAVKRSDIGRNAVNGSKIASGAVRSSDVGNDSLTGTDVNESTLGEVPSASTANTATTANNSNQLGGVSLRGLSQWVLVDSAGAVVRSSGGVTATRLGGAGTGRYRVTFPSDVSNCGYSANGGTSADAGDATDFAHRMVMIGRSSTAPTDIQIETTNDAGAEADNPFYLTVQC